MSNVEAGEAESTPLPFLLVNPDKISDRQRWLEGDLLDSTRTALPGCVIRAESGNFYKQRVERPMKKQAGVAAKRAREALELTQDRASEIAKLLDEDRQNKDWEMDAGDKAFREGVADDKLLLKACKKVVEEYARGRRESGGLGRDDEMWIDDAVFKVRTVAQQLLSAGAGSALDGDLRRLKDHHNLVRKVSVASLVATAEKAFGMTRTAGEMFSPETHRSVPFTFATAVMDAYIREKLLPSHPLQTLYAQWDNFVATLRQRSGEATVLEEDAEERESLPSAVEQELNKLRIAIGSGINKGKVGLTNLKGDQVMINHQDPQLKYHFLFTLIDNYDRRASVGTNSHMQSGSSAAV